MKLRILFFLACAGIFFDGESQGLLKTVEIDSISADGIQAKRYEIARVGYNSHHWQAGGAIVVELFHKYFKTGYEKFSIEYGYGQGTHGSFPEVRHLESFGGLHTAKLSLGDTINIGTSYGGKPNIEIPIYIDVRYYSKYNVKLSFMQEVVDSLTSFNQIQILGNSDVNDIIDFTAELAPINISSNRNVGIQTRNPQSKLHIGSSVRGIYADTLADLISTDGIIIGSGKALSLDQNYKTHAFIEYSPRINTESRFIHQGYYGHAFTIRNNAPALSILGNNGNVGLGTVSPVTKLDVSSSSLNPPSDSGISPNGLVRIGYSNRTWAGTEINIGVENNSVTSYPGWIQAQNPTNLSVQRPLLLNPLGGSIGVGTATIPSGYLMAIDGKLIVEKVVVRNSSSWPDFVFEESYDLPKLSDIEKFVKINHHLPEVPSAKEIENDGLDLDKMNRLLLKKVEELTLYLLSHQKEIEALKLEVKELKDK